ncbi:MAG TPA: biotin/lipoyl-binding protein, partial [Longimicrobiaceae bacterium]|nr:biotin/lipoyl-binding protein [Longimicrobiaceae bacterium]
MQTNATTPGGPAPTRRPAASAPRPAPAPVLGASNRRRTYVAIGAVVVLALLAFWYFRGRAGKEPEYRTAAVERGSVQQTVSATGTLNAVKTVQVGTQVSGQVSAEFADFNDRVRRGQLLAQIDPTLQQQAVRDA